MRLQDAQQIDLHFRIDGANLVEEKRAAVGHFDFAFARPIGSGECALFMAEEFAFQQALGNAAAIDGHQRRIAALAAGVDRPGDKLLAGPALAEHQHGGLGLGDVVDQLQHLSHGRALTDNFIARGHFVDRAAEPDVFLVQAALGQRLGDDEAQLLGVDRLRHVVRRAELQRLDRRIDRRECRNHHDDRPRPAAADLFEQLDAVHAGQPHVQAARHHTRQIPAPPAPHWHRRLRERRNHPCETNARASPARKTRRQQSGRLHSGRSYLAAALAFIP